MDTGFIVCLIIAFAIGIVGGMIIEAKMRPRPETQGVLVIDCNDLDGRAELFLQLKVSIEEIVDKEQTIFTVHVIN